MTITMTSLFAFTNTFTIFSYYYYYYYYHHDYYYYYCYYYYYYHYDYDYDYYYYYYYYFCFYFFWCWDFNISKVGNSEVFQFASWLFWHYWRYTNDWKESHLCKLQSCDRFKYKEQTNPRATMAETTLENQQISRQKNLTQKKNTILTPCLSTLLNVSTNVPLSSVKSAVCQCVAQSPVEPHTVTILLSCLEKEWHKPS